MQGSKVSGLLYSIYCNEIPILHRLMQNSNKYQLITGHNTKHYTDVTHNTTNFIDDSTSIISFKHCCDISSYLCDYYDLLHNFYNMNNLLVNWDKTKLLLVHKPKHAQSLQNFSCLANGYVIKPLQTIKIQGLSKWTSK